LKDLSFFNKIIFFVNNVFALLFVISFAIPYVSPRTLPILSLLSLAVPLLIWIHLLFIFYWLLSGFKRQFLLSLFCILLAISFSYFPYKFQAKEVISGSSFSVMNYNVRIVNRYGWIKDRDVPAGISEFIAEQDPDLLSMQEYYPADGMRIDYPHKYEKLKGENHHYGLAIFSKFPILSRGSLDFENTANNAIYVDILRNGDTIRVYNVHLESLGIKPDSVDLTGMDEMKSRKTIQRLMASFTRQQPQVEQVLEHMNQCNHKVILCGDFNNTSYSWAYRKLKGDLQDSFLEAGKGFGRTYSFNSYPLRIDFIFADKAYQINGHYNYNEGLSDHEPILTRLGI
jgi:endonuclease/exonuclease/phosphatase family metal-dependent hydrolase